VAGHPPKKSTQSRKGAKAQRFLKVQFVIGPVDDELKKMFEGAIWTLYEKILFAPSPLCVKFRYE
jgi:hypothetical protein